MLHTGARTGVKYCFTDHYQLDLTLFIYYPSVVFYKSVFEYSKFYHFGIKKDVREALCFPNLEK